MNSKIDRRAKSRVDLCLSCRIEGEAGTSDNSGKTTENISRDGLLLRWTRQTPAPPPGAALRVEVELPSDGAFAPRLMRCDSTVIRIIPGDKGFSHVALKVHNMRFVEDPIRVLQNEFGSREPGNNLIN
jgi:hypothetical protein